MSNTSRLKAVPGTQKPYGYAVEANDGHITFFKDDPKGFRTENWGGLMTVHSLYTTPQEGRSVSGA
jgi:hypothetical protein